MMGTVARPPNRRYSGVTYMGRPASRPWWVMYLGKLITTSTSRSDAIRLYNQYITDHNKNSLLIKGASQVLGLGQIESEQDAEV